MTMLATAPPQEWAMPGWWPRFIYVHRATTLDYIDVWNGQVVVYQQPIPG
jgi:hypothetical protein